MKVTQITKIRESLGERIVELRGRIAVADIESAVTHYIFDSTLKGLRVQTYR